MACDADPILCEQLNEIVRALNDPWDGFLGVLLATLVGAVIGAAVAFAFAMILRRQQRRDELRDWRVRERQRYEEGLHERVAVILISLYELAAALMPTDKAGNRTGLAMAPRDLVLQNIRIAQWSPTRKTTKSSSPRGRTSHAGTGPRDSASRTPAITVLRCPTTTWSASRMIHVPRSAPPRRPRGGFVPKR
jgi:phosphate/sulfate permease